MNPEDSAGTRAGLLLAEAVRIAAASVPVILLYLVVTVGGGFYVDTQTDGMGGEILVLNIASIAVLYFMTKAMIENPGLAPDGLVGGFGTYFGIAILSGLAVVLGILLLVLPGLFLIVRWAPAYGYGLAETGGVTEGLGKAWEATEHHWVAVGLAMLLPGLLYFGGLVLLFYSTDDLGMVSPAGSLLSNVMIFGGTAASSAIGIATYSLTSHRLGQDTFADVFI